jgi:hypothetical protein
MSADTSDPHQRGLNFETFLYKAFALFDMEPRLKYSLEYEQTPAPRAPDHRASRAACESAAARQYRPAASGLHRSSL